MLYNSSIQSIHHLFSNTNLIDACPATEAKLITQTKLQQSFIICKYKIRFLDMVFHVYRSAGQIAAPKALYNAWICIYFENIFTIDF